GILGFYVSNFTGRLRSKDVLQRRAIILTFLRISYFTEITTGRSATKTSVAKMVRNSHLNFATLELSTRAHLGDYNFRRRYSSSISSARSKSGQNGQTVAE
ncbi:hypothetical protein PIB30_038819, partial [Stylosanthes scabra]|nr:hypothetical protein [Stylosanthes scabra]